MKWPLRLTLIRHGQSSYNILKAQRNSDPEYQEFLAAYRADYRSVRTQKLAGKMRDKYALNVSDYDTPLSSIGHHQALKTGEGLRQDKERVKLPHVILVSPYLRTRQTLEGLIKGWPELAAVKVVYEDRIRERENGLALLYNDYNVFHVFHPDQKEFYDLMGPYWYQYPQGESISQVRDRTRAVKGMLIREYSGQRVMMVTHHLTILSWRANQERLSPEQFMDLDENQKPINCGVTIYHGCASQGRDGKLSLTHYNVKYY